MKNFGKLVTAVLVCELVGLAATPFTIASIPTWYATLNKPSFSPPNWIFGPVWTILYLLMGVSAYLVWQHGLKKKSVRTALVYFLLQLVFNFFWSFLFFYLHSPTFALIDIILLWITIAFTIAKFQKLSKTGAYLLVPYLLWVSFAAALNLAIVVLN